MPECQKTFQNSGIYHIIISNVKNLKIQWNGRFLLLAVEEWVILDRARIFQK